MASPSRWQGDCGDVVVSLWPMVVRSRAIEATNMIGHVMLGTPDLGAQMDRMLDGEWLTDPAAYTATAMGGTR